MDVFELFEKCDGGCHSVFVFMFLCGRLVFTDSIGWALQLAKNAQEILNETTIAIKRA